MNILDKIKQAASRLNKKIVLCEGEDNRVVKAAADAVKEGIAQIVLLGDEAEIRKNNPDVNLEGVTVINHLTSDKLPAYNELLCKLRASKGMTPEQASELLKDATYFGAMMLKTGEVDGLVSGACHSTANTLRPGLQIIKTAPAVSAVTSFNLMICPEQGNQYCRAKHDNVTLVAEATKIAKQKAPDLKLDGELQFDAAIVPSVGEMKAPGSSVAGHANVFIFPDLQAGNIGYKIAERLGGFMAVGPICQGFAKPMNDLSRGCKTEDIVAAVAITALQTQF